MFKEGVSLDSSDRIELGEYVACTFTGIDFSSLDLSDYDFNECVFTDCNFSNAKLQGTRLQKVKFVNCKMLGNRFDVCHKFGLSFTFEGCQLSHSSFYEMKIKNTVFKDCQLHEVDFTEADLSNVVFDNCDLMRAVFQKTNLQVADFSTAVNYSLDPAMNRVRKAKFSINGLPGLLTQYALDIKA